jgi:hypothetical protein
VQPSQHQEGQPGEGQRADAEVEDLQRGRQASHHHQQEGQQQVDRQIGTQRGADAEMEDLVKSDEDEREEAVMGDGELAVEVQELLLQGEGDELELCPSLQDSGMVSVGIRL